MIEWHTQIFAVVLFIVHWTIRLSVGLIIIMRRRSPAAAFAWLGLVALAPIPGMILYFLVGENRLGARDVKRYRKIINRIDDTGKYAQIDQRIINSDVPQHLEPIANLVSGYGGSRPLGGNTVTILDRTDEFIQQLVNDIDHAEHHCHLLYYIFNVDDFSRRIATALIKASQRGLSCRLLVDAVGSRQLVHDDLWNELRNANVKLAEALPVNYLRARVERLDLRNHRKLAVIDGHIAYSGSHNISAPLYPRKEIYGSWIDATIRMQGPIAAPLQRTFIEDWGLAIGELIPDDEDLLPHLDDFIQDGIIIQTLPTGPLSPESPVQQVVLQALHMAREEIILTTPYFVPDEATVNAMCAAARRGVQIIMVVPRKSDNRFAQAAGRSHYGQLLDEGIEIHEFTDGLLHAKTLTIDRNFGLIGSANLDLRSFFLNFEVGILIYNTDAASELRFLQQKYLGESERLSQPQWRKRPYRNRLGDNIAKLMSPLL